MPVSQSEATKENQPGLGRGKGIEDMMRSRILGVGVVLLAAVALSAMVVASAASAAPTFLLAEWLENATGVTETMLVEATGELLLENTKAPVVKGASVECSGILIGDIGPNGADDITELLNLSTETINKTALTAKELTCTDEENCESNKVWAVNLPWLSLLVLWEQGTESGFVDLLTSPTSAAKKVGWYVECTVLGVKASEECVTTEAASSAANVATGVENTFADSFTELMGLELAECSGNKEKTGIITGSGVTGTSLAGPLTVSE